jgi:hypothetical protein
MEAERKRGKVKQLEKEMEYAKELQAYFGYWAPCPVGTCEGRCVGGFGCESNPTSRDCVLWVAAWRRQVELAKRQNESRRERPGRECDDRPGLVFVVRWIGTEFRTVEALKEQVMLRWWTRVCRIRVRLVSGEESTTAVVVVQLSNISESLVREEERWVLWHDEEKPASVDVATVVVEHRGAATDWERVVKAEGL